MSSGQDLGRTPLYDLQLERGAKMVPFAGWELPVQYQGLTAEHNAVRSGAGLFDVSHMGELKVTGPEAEKALDYLTCNEVSSLQDGEAHYTALTTPSGGVVDDIIIYRLGADQFFLCVNAANTARDFEWLQEQNRFNATIEDHSSEYVQLALQGPKAAELASKLPGGSELSELKYFSFVLVEISGIPVLAARTGYTGEDGFEFFLPWHDGVSFWKILEEYGAAYNLTPCGLGSRDTLRLEVCYPLHGHELGEDITAVESGLGWVVKPDKGDFLGRDVLAQQKKEGAPRSLVGFYVEDEGIVRHGAKVFTDSGEQVGIVTSGTKTPTVQRALGLALVDSAHKKVGTELFAEVRGRKLRCQVAKRPFYRRPQA